MPRCRTPLGSWIASSTRAWRPVVRRVTRRQHPADDLEVVGEDRQALAARRGSRSRTRATRPPSSRPRCPSSARPPLITSRVEIILAVSAGRPIGGGEHEMAQPRPRRSPPAIAVSSTNGSKIGASLGWRVDLEVVVQPQRLEARAPRPGGRRRPSAAQAVAPSRPEVLAVAALRQGECRSSRRGPPTARSAASIAVAHLARRSRRRPVRSSAIECHRPGLADERAERPHARPSTSSQVTPIASGRMSTPGPVRGPRPSRRRRCSCSTEPSTMPSPTGWPWMKCRPVSCSRL